MSWLKLSQRLEIASSRRDHIPLEVRELLEEAADFAKRVEAAPVGVVNRMGSDEKGEPRLIVVMTEKGMRESPNLVFRSVYMVPITEGA